MRSVNDPADWSWAFGVGDDGWQKLRAFVENGGTLLAIGSAVETAHDLLDLPIEKALPGGGGRAAAADAGWRAGGQRNRSRPAPSIARCATPSPVRRT